MEREEATDRELVRRAARGEREAFRELVERYQGRVLAVVVGMLHDREAALEVTQEVFLKAYRSLDRFKGDASFYTWLYRIAVNQSIDYQRREARRPTPEVSKGAPPGGEERAEPLARLASDDPSADPFRAASDAELLRRMRQALDELTPDHKAVIVLRELEGLSYEEISQVMRCSKGTVMSRLHYARKKLQARLREFR